MLRHQASMTNLLITSKRVRLNVPIPANSRIAVTDVFFENQGYNILDGRLEISLFSDQESMSETFKIFTLPGYWHVLNCKLTPGHYKNLKAFQKECLFAASNLKTAAERKIIHTLFSRFKDEGGRLKILPSFENNQFANFLFRINFIDTNISKYLGLHNNELLIDNQGMAESLVWAPYMRPYTGPPLNLLNFERSIHFSILCEEVDTCFTYSKELCSFFLNKPVHTKQYIQPRNVTFHRLTNNDHYTLTFSWPDTIKLIFFNLSIITK